jgi:hypothetical protein
MRALWEEHDACDGSSLQKQQKGRNSRNNKRQTKTSRASQWAVIVVVVVVAIAAFVILSATSRGTDTKPATTTKEQHLLQPPLSIIRSGFILDENIAAWPSTRTIITRPTAATTTFYGKNNTKFSGPSTNGSDDGDDSLRNTEITICNALAPLFPESDKNSMSCESKNSSNEDNDDSNTKTSSAHIPSLTTEISTTKQKGKREQHRFKPKEAITRLFGN